MTTRIESGMPSATCVIPLPTKIGWSLTGIWILCLLSFSETLLIVHVLLGLVIPLYGVIVMGFGMIEWLRIKRPPHWSLFSVLPLFLLACYILFTAGAPLLDQRLLGD